MLERPSPRVSMYLDCAASAREDERRAKDDDTRAFHARREAAWMNLAASAAFAERVDLFLHTIIRTRGIPPADRCPDCHGLMRFRTVEFKANEQIFSFDCQSCGATELRTVAWQPIATAPRLCDLEIAVLDRDGLHPAIFPCRRVSDGWINAETEKQIEVHPTHWRPWHKPAGV